MYKFAVFNAYYIVTLFMILKLGKRYKDMCDNMFCLLYLSI